MSTPIVLIVAKSGTGKTTLLEKLIAVASDSRLEIDVPLFDINDVRGLCDLIVAKFLS